jgi:hypothetical protein
MKPKEKAKELVDKLWIFSIPNSNGSWQNAKKSALITVNEIINSNPYTKANVLFDAVSNKLYWQEVKEEIEKL